LKVTPLDASSQTPESQAVDKLGKADLHVHTCHDGWGDGNDTVLELFDFVEHHTDLDLFAITDHDSTDASRRGLDIHRSGNYRFDFLPGTEVTTTSGHLICYFPGEIVEVPSLRSLRSTVEFVHAHDGVCVMAHPVYPSWIRRRITTASSEELRFLDGVEIVNGGLSAKTQAKLDVVSCLIDDRIGVVGNSDAHHHSHIATVYTEFPGSSKADYLAALSNRLTRPVRRERPDLPGSARRFTFRRSMTRPGWVRNFYREKTGKFGQPT
jgi:PHP-associated